MKDLFSNQAATYARYRPTYPQELYEWLLERVPGRERALDSATGNGQAAAALADYFTEVEATDLSEGQLAQAVQRDNIHYRVSRSEETPFPDNHFDLMTMAQAFHWMDAPRYCAEMNRVGRPGAIVACWSYKFPLAADSVVNKVIRDFYDGVTGPYWEPERRHVDNDYAELAFDFDDIETARFESVLHWKREELLGYFASWSATQKYIRLNGHSPLVHVEGPLSEVLPADVPVEVRFPLFLKAGRVRK
ncbi:methyltransferase domain-containing protein [Flaviaesturariibacter flavus]|uniref:Methyltransferase domain-containing protein n=1 Tax=Flaviaesturariibacter flavus TaxID=2502780 RepID=A0A4R1B7F6_9BACT|nr:class I SAM-dependent methyltransferase [Flaviaesturariibacter flavus]TCJ12468.1 methyltransferase domain-containing protein [Flaviaesturariibacter flavus]